MSENSSAECGGTSDRSEDLSIGITGGPFRFEGGGGGKRRACIELGDAQLLAVCAGVVKDQEFWRDGNGKPEGGRMAFD